METEHSKKFNDIKFYYEHHIWRKTTVKKACKTGRITAAPARSMWPDCWPALCEELLTQLETLGADTSTARSRFATLVASCSAQGCRILKGENNYDQNVQPEAAR